MLVSVLYPSWRHRRMTGGIHALFESRGLYCRNGIRCRRIPDDRDTDAAPPLVV